MQPVFAPAPASFVVTLPNVNENIPETVNSDYTDEEKVLNLVKKNKIITRGDVEKVLQSSSFPAINIINKLLNEKKIIRIGAARSTKYALIE